jgi:hypothetical protein
MIIGGNDGRVQNRVECLNLQNGMWSKLPKMNMKRDELAACMGPDGSAQRWHALRCMVANDAADTCSKDRNVFVLSRASPSAASQH